jgi:hypothetical protein
LKQLFKPTLWSEPQLFASHFYAFNHYLKVFAEGIKVVKEKSKLICLTKMPCLINLRVNAAV